MKRLKISWPTLRPRKTVKDVLEEIIGIPSEKEIKVDIHTTLTEVFNFYKDREPAFAQGIFETSLLVEDTKSNPAKKGERLYLYKDFVTNKENWKENSAGYENALKNSMPSVAPESSKAIFINSSNIKAQSLYESAKNDAKTCTMLTKFMFS